MASWLSRAFCRGISLSSSTAPKFSPRFSQPFCASSTTQNEPEPEPYTPSYSLPPSSPGLIYDRPLENGMDSGIYKAILVGKVGQSPVQKTLKRGGKVTLLSVGTGGLRKRRWPGDNEGQHPNDNRDQTYIQWHRVSVYPVPLGQLVLTNATPGSILYLEGNLESKIFTDPATGLVRSVREIAIRKNGRVVFIGRGGETERTYKFDKA